MGNVKRQLSYTFPPGNTQDIALTQTLAAAGALTLNGNLASGFSPYGYNRQVSISAAAGAGINFTVTGSQNGVTITEVIAGVNGTAYGELTYDVVTSITASNAVANVSAGSGWLGFFNIIQLDLNAGYINGAISLGTTGLLADTNSYIIYGTADNLINNGQTYETMTTVATSNYNLFTISTVAPTPQFYYPLLITTSLTTLGAGNSLPATQAIFYQYMIQIGTDAGSIANGVKLNFFQIAG